MSNCRWWVLSGYREYEHLYGLVAASSRLIGRGLKSIFYIFRSMKLYRNAWLGWFKRTRRGESVIGNGIRRAFVTSGNSCCIDEEIGQCKERKRDKDKGRFRNYLTNHGAAPTSLFPLQRLSNAGRPLTLETLPVLRRRLKVGRF